MQKYISSYIILLVVVFISIPNAVSAATVYLESSRDSVSVGDTFIVSVKMNSDGEVLNTVEGDISLSFSDKNVSISEFSLANSSFGVWPRTPSLSSNGKTVSFVGGVPGGFSIEGATLFSIVVEANKEGEVVFAPQGLSVFLNDGAGTKTQVTAKPLKLQVSSKNQNGTERNDWAAVVSSDTKPPEDFIVVLGQDDSLFEGKKFAFFSAVDNQSGIDHYEVSENGQASVRSGSTYVLQDQSDNVKLRVVAIDKAGNTKTANFPTSDNKPISWVSIIVVLVLILGIRFVYRKWKQKKNIVTNV